MTVFKADCRAEFCERWASEEVRSVPGGQCSPSVLRKEGSLDAMAGVISFFILFIEKLSGKQIVSPSR